MRRHLIERAYNRAKRYLLLTLPSERMPLLRWPIDAQIDCIWLFD